MSGSFAKPAALDASSRPRGVVIGASAGGLEALHGLLASLPSSFGLPVVFVQHLYKDDAGRSAQHLDATSRLTAIDVDDKEPLRPGHLYVAPANYHLLVEAGGETLALSVDPPVRWSRPSIDVLLESAARAWGAGAIAALLSGADDDGAEGMCWIERLGGICVVQDPASAKYPTMPRAAIERVTSAHILAPEAIGALLVCLVDQRPAPGAP